MTTSQRSAAPPTWPTATPRWADWERWTSELLGVDVEIDTSSPEQPRNTFTKDAARSLGGTLDRGHEGIRAHLRELIAQMAADRV